MRLLLSILLLLPFFCSAQLTNTHLPIVVINTNGETIQDEPKILVDIGIINNANGINNINDPYNEYEGKIGIELRGQTSSWFPKKQYGIEFRNDSNEEIKVSVLGFPEDSDFVLSAPYSDKSLMRNALTYILAGRIMDYAPRVRYCELILDEEYKGVYILTEKIKRTAGRLDLAKLKPEDIEGEDVEGGYIVRFDKYDTSLEVLWESPYDPYQNAFQTTQFIAAYPKYNKIQPEQLTYIRDYITDFENALDDEEFTYQGVHYSEMIDVNSVIDFMLMNELARNVDGYRISTYMYKDKGEPLKMGPVWDFNLAFGNADYCQGGEPIGWEWDFNLVCGQDGWVNHFWWKRFLTDEAFTTAMRQRWELLRENEFSNANICGTIDSLQAHIGNAASRNFQTWPILGEYVWPNRFIGNTYEQEIEYLKAWVEIRLNFMDVNIDKLVNTSAEVEPFGIFPNPNSGQFILQLGNLSYQHLFLDIFDSAGALVSTIKLKEYDGGILTPELSKGVYYYYLRNSDQKLITETKKFVLVR